MNERIQAIIDAKKIKKIDFARRLNLSQAFISELCSGAKSPSDRTISDICREFNINETWLRTGDGEMFTETAQEDQILAFMGDVMHGAPDFRRRLMSVLSRMTPDEWTLLEKKAWELVEEMKKADPEGPAE